MNVEIDVIPAHSSVEAETDGDRVRFRACDAHGHYSEWSGWFTTTSEPIALTWSAFSWT